ncbi:MAG: hypothetical protein ACQEP9_01875 [Bacillota bacterium]
MSWASVDLVFLLLTGGLISVINFLAAKLPSKILIKGQSNQVIFSLAKKKIKWLILGLSLYVWLMEFLILNQLLLLRLVSPLLLQGSLFSLLVITSLGHRKLGERLSIASFIFFVISVIYFVV